MNEIRNYIVGFVLSIALTLAAFSLITLYGQGVLSATASVAALLILMVLQLIVQLVCFLHVGRAQKTEWNSIVLFFTIFTVLVLVGGSLWIMQNLNQNMDTAGTYLNGIVSPKYEND